MGGLWAAGECIHSLFKGEDTPHARVGALLIAQGLRSFDGDGQ